MKVLYSILILIFLFLVPLVKADSIDIEYNIEFGKVLVTENINLDTANSLEIFLPKDAKALSLYLEKNKVEANIKNNELIIPVSKDISFNFISGSYLEKAKKNYFITEIDIPIEIEKLNVKVILPTKAILDKPLTEDGSSYPKPDKTETDGQRHIFLWQSENLKKGDKFSIFLIYKEEKNLYWVAIPVILVIAGFVYFVYRKKQKILLPKLIGAESSIINILKKEKNYELWQKQIQIKTGLSKAKLSRTLRNLESRGLIKKTPYGNTNKIKLILK